MKVNWYSIDHTVGIWRMNELVLYKIWTLYILPCDQMLVYIGYQKHVIMANKKNYEQVSLFPQTFESFL